MLHPCCSGEEVFIFAIQKYVQPLLEEIFAYNMYQELVLSFGLNLLISSQYIRDLLTDLLFYQ
jgi:hypothetical protein